MHIPWIKYEICQGCLLRDIMCTKFLLFDLWWPKWLWPQTEGWRTIYLVWPTHTQSVTLVKVTLLEISYLQGFCSLIAGDLKRPLTSTKITGTIYLAWPTHKQCVTLVKVSLLEIPCLQGFCSFTFSHLKRPWPQPNMIWIINQPTHQVWHRSRLPFWSYWVYKVLAVWPLVTLNDLYPPSKIREIIY